MYFFLRALFVFSRHEDDDRVTNHLCTYVPWQIVFSIGSSLFFFFFLFFLRETLLLILVASELSDVERIWEISGLPSESQSSLVQRRVISSLHMSVCDRWGPFFCSWVLCLGFGNASLGKGCRIIYCEEIKQYGINVLFTESTPFRSKSFPPPLDLDVKV